MVDVATVHSPSLKARIGGSQDAEDRASNKNDILKFYYHTGVVDSGGGADTLTFYGICDVTVQGGKGDDRIDFREARPESHAVIDGGSGTDILHLGATRGLREFVDWSDVKGVEWIGLWGANNSWAVFDATDEMFGGIHHLSIAGFANGPRAHGNLKIDGSEVTAGGLSLFGIANGANTLIGGTRDDELVGREHNDWFEGGAGNDTIVGGDGSDRAAFSGDLANYSIVYDFDADTVTVTDNVGDDGTDILQGVERFEFADESYLVLDAGMKLRGTGRVDVFKGGTGDDWMDGKGGADKLNGDYGNDSLIGGGGSDILFGGGGDDWISGGAGNDKITGDEGSDTLLGGAGNDHIEDRASSNEYITIDTGSGNDDVRVFGGTVMIIGGSGDDVLRANDAVRGSVDGGDGDDNIRFSLRASGVAMTITGGEGDDSFLGSLSDGITVWGGNGDDNVTAQHYSSGYFVDLGEGTDTIMVMNYLEGYKPSLDWSAIHSAEVLTLRHQSNTSSRDDWQVSLNDDMFANQDRWIVSAEPDKPRASKDRVQIDASDVTAGHLEIIGRSQSIDTLLGGALDDTLRGLSGDDFLIGNGGNDLLDGGKGNDFVYYHGNFADYSVDVVDGKVIVTALVGDEGIDTLVNVEALRFEDKLLAL